ncbi:MAG: tRNA lysidine(34) synthetase TilS [Thermosynechococcaceae cyanobacterium MS004]|nr:tRNA lysidine(34) synthetase TilS [Thermosynechococcaceae cyanobacterium MS004]
MAWTTLHATVQQTLQQRHLLSKGQAFVLGFSGGQDSLCLLQILRDLQPRWGWRLAIAHCNHLWPPDSTANAEYVADLAQRWGLAFYPFTAPQPLQGEAEGRDWRYQILTTLAQEQGFSAVLTAHTASDRAETLLLNLLRGSGMDGLQALVWQRSLSAQVQLIRPLLAVTRQQTGAFCEQLALPVWQDSMNDDLVYRRNQVRLNLLPLLRQQFNPQIDGALARTAEILQAETAYLDQQASELLQRAECPDLAMPDLPISDLAIICPRAVLDQRILQQSVLAIQRRALRQWLAQHLNIQPNFEQIEKTVALIHGFNGDRTDPFKAMIVAEVRRPWLYLRNLASQG